MAKGSKITLISARAKKIYKKGIEKWSDAISRATKAAMRAGFRELGYAIRNAVDQKILKGKIIGTTGVTKTT